MIPRCVRRAREAPFAFPQPAIVLARPAAVNRTRPPPRSSPRARRSRIAPWIRRGGCGTHEEAGGAPVRGKGYIADDLTDHAIDFIRQHKDGPFFCYLPYNTPHSPFHVPDRFHDRFAGAEIAMRHRDPQKEDLATTRCVLALCENIDWNVGRVLDALAELELDRTTIVVYFSDNGPNIWRWNGGMRGRKGSTDEGGLRVPCLVRWPGRIAPGARISRIAGAIDLLPTLADMAGIPRIGVKPLDGASLAPLLRDPQAAWPDRMLFSHQGGKSGVRTQTHRLDAAGKLFDLTVDPGQDRDIVRDLPETAARLAAAVASWSAEVLPAGWKDDRPFPVGRPAFPVTPLPARDGVPSGGVRRSAGAPNCSFFTGWKDAGDRIAWDIEVATAGIYEAVIDYTCPAGDVGATVELSFGSSRVTAKVVEAHDPPLVGAADDRVPRAGESYVKDFRPLRPGEFQLVKGRGALVLRALEVPGSQVMDVRGVVLTLRK